MDKRARITRRTGTARAGGFTLTELLVAMVIFITVFAGVAALFTGAVSTVRQGYQTMDAYEIARSAMQILERDLRGGFIARELGQRYSFYGRPDGFIFVGALEDGQLGRVAYWIQPEDESFRSELTERFHLIAEQIMVSWMNRGYPARGFDIACALAAWCYDDRGPEAFDPLDRDDFMADFDAAASDFLVQASAYLAYIDGDGPEAPWPALDRGPAYNTGVRDYRYGDVYVTIEVEVRLATLRRFEEPLTDLDRFDLPGGAAWPYVDTRYPVEDTCYDRGDGDTNCGLLDEILTAFQPVDTDGRPAGNPDYDLRRLMGELIDNGQRNYISEDVIEQIVSAKKREIFLNALKTDDFWAGRDPADYILADNILYSATPVNAYVPAGFRAYDPYPGLAEDLGRQDLLGVSREGDPTFFLYSDGSLDISNQPRFINSFNDIDNISGYVEFKRELNNAGMITNLRAARAAAAEFDDDLANAMSYQGTLNTAAGSPLDPRLPWFVSPQFWITMEPSWQGLSDFRHWFSQQVDIPSAFTR
jgi:prepilin-type N-terminal cleavage/methylation domain-containing protein